MDGEVDILFDFARGWATKLLKVISGRLKTKVPPKTPRLFFFWNIPKAALVQKSGPGCSKHR